MGRKWESDLYFPEAASSTSLMAACKNIYTVQELASSHWVCVWGHTSCPKGSHPWECIVWFVKFGLRKNIWIDVLSQSARLIIIFNSCEWNVKLRTELRYSFNTSTQTHIHFISHNTGLTIFKCMFIFLKFCRHPGVMFNNLRGNSCLVCIVVVSKSSQLLSDNLGNGAKNEFSDPFEHSQYINFFCATM